MVDVLTVITAHRLTIKGNGFEFGVLGKLSAFVSRSDSDNPIKSSVINVIGEGLQFGGVYG